MNIFSKKTKDENRLSNISSSSLPTSFSNNINNSSETPKLLDTFKENLHPILKAGMQEELSILPHFIQEMTRFEEANFADHALKLMSASIAERQYSTIYDYEAVQKACKEMFKDESLHSRFQAKIHAALLLDLSKEEDRLEIVENFKLFLDKNQSSLKIPPMLLEELRNTLYSLTMGETREKYNIGSRFFEEFEIVFLEHNILQKKEELFYNRENNGDLANINNTSKARNPMARAFSFRAMPRAAHSIISTSKKGKNLSLSLLSSVKERLLPDDKQSLTNENYSLTTLSKDEELKDMENFSLALRSMDLLEKIHNFRSLFVPQDFRIVVLGEGKRGKSTLINALLGKEILPTRAVLPETSTVLELSYSKEPYYEIEWLDEYEFTSLDESLKEDEENLLLKEKLQSFKHILQNKEILENLRSTHINHIDELHEYASPDGLYSSLVKKIRIGLKEENLPKGIHLVDTPATNASDPFLHYLTKKECLMADCLILLLDSRQPDNYAELQLLKSIIKEGRAVKIIGLLTHPLESEVENELAKERAHKVLAEMTREVAEISLLGVFSFNPKEVIEHYEKNKNVLTQILSHRLNSEYLEFLEVLTGTIKIHAEQELSSARMEESYSHLCASANKSKEEILASYSKSLPSTLHISLLEKHASSLVTASESYAKHARSLVINALSDIEEWHRQSIKAIDELEERIVLNLSNEMHMHANRLGDKFAKESEWKEFDEVISGLIAQELIDEFKKEQKISLSAFEEKIHTFNNEVEKLSLECLSELQKSSTELNILCGSNSRFDHMLVQTNSYMQKITLLLSGAGVGMLANAGLVNILALGTASLAFLTNPIVIPSALILGIGAFALKKFTNPVKLKEAFLKRKEEKVRVYTKKLKEDLYAQADEMQEELLFAYSSSIHKSLAPALEIMASEAVNINLYLEALKKQNLNLDLELCTTQEHIETKEEI